MKKRRVAIIMGGPSTEHEISLQTGTQILNTLSKERFDVVPIVISKEGKWFFGHNPQQFLENSEGGGAKPHKATFLSLQDQSKELHLVKDKGIDVIFIALHGTYGEDGTIQALFELAGIPYTGSGIIASALGMDKAKSLSLFRDNGLSVPEFIEINMSAWEKDPDATLISIVKYIGFPAIVKPLTGGSSIGITIVGTEKGLGPAIYAAFEQDLRILVQRYVRGREITCGIVDYGKGNAKALQPTEIIPKNSDYFDFEAKYIPEAVVEITPPDLPQDVIAEIQNIALIAHQTINCSGMSRSDMILMSCNSCDSTYINCNKDHVIYILEINTIPGMTETSLFPQAAKASGISFSNLLEQIIDAALERHESRNNNLW